MGYVAYLQRGSKKLNLNNSPYAVYRFSSPAIQEAANISDGTSANQYGGSTLIDKRVMSSPYSFSVRILTTSSGAVESAIQRLDKFVRSGSEVDPVYFCWKPNNNVSVEPLFGQWGAVLRCKIVNGNAYKSGSLYGTANLRERIVIANIDLLINAPEGVPQRVGMAAGGIQEDTVGAADGVSRGVMLPRATTNKAPNPIYGHGTWDTGYTASAGLDAALNTDEEFVLFGTNSARLVNRNTASGLLWYITINVGDTSTYSFSKYVKRSDGAAVTSTDASLYYDEALATTYTAVGDGWYRLRATFTGIAANTVAGLVVGAGRAVYTDGLLIESGTYVYATPLIHGDMLGCSWAGTAHASASTRAAPVLKYPVADIHRRGYGTIWAAWRAPAAHTSYAQDGYVFYIYSAANPFYLYWDYANARWRLSDGTNIINFTDTITAGELFIFHCVYGPSSMKLYINGAEAATGAAYTPPSGTDYLYIGTSVAAATPIGGTFHGFGSYNYNLSAAEVLADYNNMLPVANGPDGLGGLVSALTYFWTKDGDNIVDNCDDSSRDNWGVIQGVPGSLPADTEFTITPSAGYLTSYLALSPTKNFTIPTSQNYYDAQGTADGGCSGGEYAGLTSSYGYAIYTPANQEDFTGRVHFFARSRHEVGSNFMNGAITYTDALTSSVAAARTDYLTCADDNTFNLYYLGHINWLYDSNALTDMRAAVEHSSGQEWLDYFMAIPGYVAKITDALGTGYYYLRGSKIYSSVTGYISIARRGDVIEVEPNKYNMLWYLQGTDSAVSTITSTATFSIYITPRWALA